jgi:ABC-2 type transport system ATP-binding protein
MEYKKRTEELLELTGLKEVAKRRIGGFSRGMRQRLGLAQALVNRPEILLLDEPVSALDPAGRKDVLELIEQLGASCTVLMSTHILADVERVCDTVGIINKGRLVTQAKREELLERYAIPALEIETGNGSSGMAAAWMEKLKNIAVIQGVEQNGQTLHIAAQNVEDARMEIMRVAVDNDLTFERFEMVKPTLEDIFMRLVNGEEVQK